MKKTLLLLLALLVLAGGFAFAGGSQESGSEGKDVIWLTSVQGGREPEENVLFQDEVERLTGVPVSLIKPPGSEYKTKMTAMLSTGEPLDIVYLTAADMAALADQDLFEPLTDWIENSPVLSDESVIPASEWERLRREDGEIYAVFNKFEQGTVPIVRYDWLQNLGLEEPKTLDDYYEVLRAFTFDDPDGNGVDDTYGMGIGYTLYDISSLFGAYGLVRGYAEDADGNLYSPFATEAAIPVYEFLARIYREGILEPNFITNKSSNFRDLFMTGKTGMNFYWAAWVGLYNQIVKADNPDSPFMARALTPPMGPNGDIMCRNGDDGLMAIPRISDNKENAFKIMEFWHTPEGNLLSTLGISGHDYTVSGNDYTLTEIGNKHAKDHGAPQPKSLKWTNPLGENEGFAEAAEIILQYGYTQMVTPYNSVWEEITRSEAAKIILGEVTPEEGIANMNARFKEEGVF